VQVQVLRHGGVDELQEPEELLVTVSAAGLGNLTFKVGKAAFTYGQFLTVALTFLISAVVVYFVLVLPISRLLELIDRNKSATTRDCPECAMSVPLAARRCPQCTAKIAPGTEQPRPVG
jgi:large conductance mechanosensitive channel